MFGLVWIQSLETHILKIMCLLFKFEHWSHSTSTSLTHLWPCIRGYTGLKEYCSLPIQHVHLEIVLSNWNLFK